VHVRAVGVEDAGDLDLQPVLAVIVEEQGFGAALALVVAAARADRIDVAPIAFGLRMDVGIAVDLAGRGLEDARAHPLGEAKHVDRAKHAGLGRLHRVVLVVDRRGRAGQIVDLVHLDIERPGDVVPHEFEVRMVAIGDQIVAGAGEQIVHAQHLVPALQQFADEVGSKETGASGRREPCGGRSSLRFIRVSSLHWEREQRRCPSRKRDHGEAHRHVDDRLDPALATNPWLAGKRIEANVEVVEVGDLGRLVETDGLALDAVHLMVEVADDAKSESRRPESSRSMGASMSMNGRLEKVPVQTTTILTAAGRALRGTKWPVSTDEVMYVALFAPLNFSASASIRANW
jgi:hypothetical protein